MISIFFFCSDIIHHEQYTMHKYRTLGSQKTLDFLLSRVSHGMSLVSTGRHHDIESRYPLVNAPSQLETMLHCNIISHWLDAYTKKLSLGDVFYITGPLCREYTSHHQFPSQKPVMIESFGICFVVSLNDLCNKHSSWFEMPWCSGDVFSGEVNVLQQYLDCYSAWDEQLVKKEYE